MSVFFRRARGAILAGTLIVLAAGLYVASSSSGSADPHASLYVARTVDPLPPDQAPAHAMFIREASAEKLAERTSAAVIATVTEVTPGPALESELPPGAITPRQAGVPAPKPLPTTNVRLRVTRELRGDVQPEIVWNHASGPDGIEVDDDPTPRVGERYVLFLTPHDRFAGRWAVPLIDGRIRIAQSKAVPSIPDFAGAKIAAAFNNGGAEAVQEVIR